MQTSTKTRILVECALCVAIASALCIYPRFKFLSYGGSITICSMLPIILISYRRGIRWGLLSGLAFALVQILTGGLQLAGFSLFAVLVVVLFDYFLPFTLLGLGGLFRGKLKSAAAELVLGGLVAMALRYACHIFSGFVVWGEYAKWFFSEAGDFGQSILARFSGTGLALIYSVVYNGLYMIPEMIITSLAAALISMVALAGLPNNSRTH